MFKGVLAVVLPLSKGASMQGKSASTLPLRMPRPLLNSLEGIPRLCQRKKCQKDFISLRPYPKFCSSLCRREEKKENPPKISALSHLKCARSGCSAVFPRVQGQKRFCSAQCRNLVRLARMKGVTLVPLAKSSQKVPTNSKGVPLWWLRKHKLAEEG